MASSSSSSISQLVANNKRFLAPSPVEGVRISSPIELYSTQYYTTCAIGGAAACGLTHALVTPLDLVKCRRQVDPTLYRGIMHGWQVIGKAEGIRGLYTGWLPTLIGYSMQGACKYGFYEVFKKKFADAMGEEAAFKYRTSLYLAASASAEVIADVALCPMEALKVRMQTTIGKPFSKGALDGFNKILANEGASGFYKGLTPLWLRQIPYTMMKFASFERTVEAIYKYALSRPRHEYSGTQQLGVTFVSGYIAGVFCAVVSHPADTLVSKLNNVAKAEGESTGALSMRILRDLGFRGVWRGLTARIYMIGTLTALQWFIYDSYKVYTGLPTTGSTDKKKAA
jgi:solute carrier family 25 phosphate transporter 3